MSCGLLFEFLFPAFDLILNLLLVDCYGKSDKSGRRKLEIPNYFSHYPNELGEADVSAVLDIKSNVQGNIIKEEMKFF